MPNQKLSEGDMGYIYSLMKVGQGCGYAKKA
jgi:hypothetical protein